MHPVTSRDVAAVTTALSLVGASEPLTSFTAMFTAFYRDAFDVDAAPTSAANVSVTYARAGDMVLVPAKEGEPGSTRIYLGFGCVLGHDGERPTIDPMPLGSKSFRSLVHTTKKRSRKHSQPLLPQSPTPSELDPFVTAALCTVAMRIPFSYGGGTLNSPGFGPFLRNYDPYGGFGTIGFDDGTLARYLMNGVAHHVLPTSVEEVSVMGESVDSPVSGDVLIERTESGDPLTHSLYLGHGCAVNVPVGGFVTVGAAPTEHVKYRRVLVEGP